MEDTIAAIATAVGEGGIGIVRISGEQALPILKKMFRSASADADAAIKPRNLHYGHIRDNFTGELIDEVMAVFMPGPHSYTAEDVAEIQCHGSVISLRKILALILQNGARLAEPGEFTKRAFLNGRLDLSQAEAVIDLIKAKSDMGFDVALSQLEGEFSQEIKAIRAALTDLRVNLTVNIDYPDEDIEEITYAQISAELREIGSKIDRLLSSADTGRIISEGLNVAIIGKPNVGKSSLMNALLHENRAIVTEIPGTTRDTIEEMVSIRGIPVKLIDTAGIRQTEDVIEKIGIEKSKASFNQADLVIFVLDASRALSEEDREIIAHLTGRKVLAIMNKQDLPSALAQAEIETALPQAKLIPAVMNRGEGLTEIEDEIERLVYQGKVQQGERLLVTNVRHQALLAEASQAIADARAMTEGGEPLEVIEIDATRCDQLLGEILGETTSGDIIDEVFSRFCLGK